MVDKFKNLNQIHHRLIQQKILQKMCRRPDFLYQTKQAAGKTYQTTFGDVGLRLAKSGRGGG